MLASYMQQEENVVTLSFPSLIQEVSPPPSVFLQSPCSNSVHVSQQKLDT